MFVLFIKIHSILFRFQMCHCLFTIAGNFFQLQEVGDFEAQNCLPALNLIRSTKLHLTTEPQISETRW